MGADPCALPAGKRGGYVQDRPASCDPWVVRHRWPLGRWSWSCPGADGQCPKSCRHASVPVGSKRLHCRRSVRAIGCRPATSLLANSSQGRRAHLTAGCNAKLHSSPGWRQHEWLRNSYDHHPRKVVPHLLGFSLTFGTPASPHFFPFTEILVVARRVLEAGF